MHIREIARKHGGDEAVAELDKGLAFEKKVTDALRDLTLQMMEGEIGPDGDDSGRTERQVLVASIALSEALSSAYAVAVANLAQHIGDRSELMVTSIRSFTNKLTNLFETHDLKASGIDKMIDSAVKAGGPLPQPEGGE